MVQTPRVRHHRSRNREPVVRGNRKGGHRSRNREPVLRARSGSVSGAGLGFGVFAFLSEDGSRKTLQHGVMNTVWGFVEMKIVLVTFFRFFQQFVWNHTFFLGLSIFVIAFAEDEFLT